MDGRVAGMSLEERGAYITLLCLCWVESSLPIEEKRLATMLGCSVPQFRRVWPALQACFHVATEPDRLIHPRLEKEREKQQAFRVRQSRAGSRSAAARLQLKANHGSTAVQPKVNSSIFNLQSPEKTKSAAAAAPTSRSRHPVFKGQRFVVFDWMLDDLARMLGPHTEAFDVHAWFFDLDAKAIAEGVVHEQREWWPWIQAQLLAEAKKRGLPVGLSGRSGDLDPAAVTAILERDGVVLS